MASVEGYIRAVFALAGMALVGLVAFLAGSLSGRQGAIMQRYSLERDAIAAGLAGDSAFSELEIQMYTGDGSAYLNGRVDTKADLDRLRRMVSGALLDARGEEPLRLVHTKEGAR